MSTLNKLREHLLNSVLNIQPEDIHVRVRRGRFISYKAQENTGQNASFQSQYDLECLIQNFKHDQSTLGHVLIDWVQAHKINYEADDIRWEADPLDADTVDILITIMDMIDTHSALKTEQNGQTGVITHQCPPAKTDPVIRQAGIKKLTAVGD